MGISSPAPCSLCESEVRNGAPYSVLLVGWKGAMSVVVADPDVFLEPQVCV